MSTKRASLLTLNSLSALSKVPSSSNPIAFSKYVTTVAQKSNFENYLIENSDHHSRNPSSSRDPVGSVQNPIGKGLNPDWGFRETTENVLGDNQIAHGGNSGRFYGQNYGDCQNYSGGYWDHNNNRKVDQNRVTGVRDVNVNRRFEQNHRDNYGGMHDNINRVYERNGNLQNPGERLRKMTQGKTGQHLPGHLQSQGSWNSSYTQNGSQYQENSNVIEGPQVSNNPNVGGLSQSGGLSPYNGTVEELDGFCKQKKVKDAVEVLRLLEERHVPVELLLLLELIEACGEAKALEEAKAVHNHMVSSLSPLSISTFNKILEMYGKCGALNVAFDVFDKMSERDLNSWDTMITWLSKNELGEDAIDLFTQFKQAGLKPNPHMYIGVFSACGVVGDVYEGMLHFESMIKDYDIVPSMDHYISIVDMLGNNGYLDEAIEFIEKMPIEPSIEIWETLMNFSRIHGNKELGDRCAELVEANGPSRLIEKSKAGLVPVKDSDLAKLKERKNLGCQNPLEVRSRTHEYRAGDTSHPENDRIYALLRGLRTQMKDEGYIAETRFVLHDIDQEGKEDALLAHSERLAAAYGFLTTPARSPIRVIKNLRVCGDCHNALKIISKIVGRELIMRDAKRFHHFKDGVCSCRDYW